ncbi:HAD family hydrolase [bacterium LRH843]|nr:HAD family hydrolase [bacterium LRH843]
MKKKAVFLDRDGVINEVLSSRVRFVNQPKDFYLLEGVGNAIRLLNEANVPVFVVTNQGGVGLGFMKEASLHRIHEKMKKDLAEFRAFVDDIAYCPHKPKAGCYCRKPEPQMLTELATKHHIDLSLSIMVGDRKPDIEAGKKAGCKTILLGEREKDITADAYFPDLLSAIPWMLEQL